MARKNLATDQIVKLIVGAGQASPSPPVGPALGSKGVKSMDFCKVRLRIYSSLVHGLRILGVQCEDGTHETGHSHPRACDSPS